MPRTSGGAIKTDDLSFKIKTKIYTTHPSEIAKIMTELQDMKKGCTEELRKLRQLFSEKKAKDKVLEDHILGELQKWDKKCDALIRKNDNNEELQRIITEKTDEVEKLKKDLAVMKQEKEGIEEMMKKDCVSRNQYMEVWEELEKQKKISDDLFHLEKQARHRVEHLLQEMKGIEKSKLELIRDRRKDQEFYLGELEKKETKDGSSRQALEIGQYLHSMSSDRIPNIDDHRLVSTLDGKGYTSLVDKFRTENFKRDYILPKRSRY